MFEAIHERSRGTSAAHPGQSGEGEGVTEKFDLQRAVGEARVVFSGAVNGTEIIDVYQQPALIRDEQILATPTLVKKGPEPERRMIGDMSNRARVLAGLGLCEVVRA